MSVRLAWQADHVDIPWTAIGAVATYILGLVSKPISDLVLGARNDKAAAKAKGQDHLRELEAARDAHEIAQLKRIEELVAQLIETQSYKGRALRTGRATAEQADEWDQALIRSASQIRALALTTLPYEDADALLKAVMTLPSETKGREEHANAIARYTAEVAVASAAVTQQIARKYEESIARAKASL